MNKKYVIAYIRDGGLERLTKEEALKLTHINIAFGKINDKGELYTKIKNFHLLDKIRGYNPDIKFLISLGGWGNGGFSEAASTEENRKNFAKDAVAFMKEHKLDGLDVDWEYPCCSISGITSSPNDKENFTLLLKAMREELNKEGEKDNRYYMLTIAAGADKYYLEFTNMGEVQKYLDYVMLMTYDLRGGFQVVTGHHTNLYSPEGDIFTISTDESVKMFEAAGVPSEKILIGAAFYSRQWNDVPNINNGYLQMAPGTGGFGADFTVLDRDFINKNGYVRYWDDVAKAPYLFNGSTFISYDDEESIKCKGEYVKENNLNGIMFWLYDADETSKLLNAVHESLN
ncbi:glycoside hydrolase family 18 protein [Clostridium sp. LP20]|uniref:glycoside hydrolase family 18 protein n=1 Tax=Clostridium sp. LP20 TaxID=3418665 RepID=UPI003EE45AF5